MKFTELLLFFLITVILVGKCRLESFLRLGTLKSVILQEMITVSNVRCLVNESVAFQKQFRLTDTWTVPEVWYLTWE